MYFFLGHKLSSSGAIDENTTPVYHDLWTVCLGATNYCTPLTWMNGWKFTQQWQRVSGRACFFVSIILQTTQGRRRLMLFHSEWLCVARCINANTKCVIIRGFFQPVDFSHKKPLASYIRNLFCRTNLQFLIFFEKLTPEPEHIYTYDDLKGFFWRF